MSTQSNPFLSIDDHPFFIGCVEPDHQDNLPNTLPFMLYLHEDMALPRLAMTSEIHAALEGAYSLGSMASTPLGESHLAFGRMEQVLNCLLARVKGDISGKSVLEVGCGNGKLLNELKTRGADVMGIEIGPQAETAAASYGLKVLRDPMNSRLFDGKFDVIYSYGCLEHIEDLEGFFAESRKSLKDGGLFLHSVPNAEYSFRHVFLDHLLHEHVNYFTPHNAMSLFESQGFVSAGYQVSQAGNELMVWGYHDPARTICWPADQAPAEAEMLRTYSVALLQKRDRIRHNLERLLAGGKTLGLYAGGYEYGHQFASHGLRYFDGDTYKHGKKWLKGLPAIEPPEALLERPVDVLVICKPHYYESITAALSKTGIDTGDIISIDSLA
jgi:SAM-dependent methyltransferase